MCQFIPLPAIFVSCSVFVSMYCFEAKSTAETGLKCICVYIHPALNSSRSEDIVSSAESGMTLNRLHGLSNFLSRPYVNIHYK